MRIRPRAHTQSPHLRLTVSQRLNETQLEKRAIGLILEDLAHCLLGRRGIVHFDLPQGLPTHARARAQGLCLNAAQLYLGG